MSFATNDFCYKCLLKLLWCSSTLLRHSQKSLHVVALHSRYTISLPFQNFLCSAVGVIAVQLHEGCAPKYFFPSHSLCLNIIFPFFLPKAGISSFVAPLYNRYTSLLTFQNIFPPVGYHGGRAEHPIFCFLCTLFPPVTLFPPPVGYRGGRAGAPAFTDVW